MWKIQRLPVQSGATPLFTLRCEQFYPLLLFYHYCFCNTGKKGKWHLNIIMKIILTWETIRQTPSYLLVSLWDHCVRLINSCLWLWNSEDLVLCWSVPSQSNRIFMYSVIKHMASHWNKNCLYCTMGHHQPMVELSSTALKP